MVKIIHDDLFKHIEEYDVILVGTNTYCTMSQGFQRDVMLHYPHVQERNMKTKYGDKNKLGTVLPVDGTPVFALCFICEGNFRPDIKPVYIDIDSLRKCLTLCSILFNGRKVATTVMGASRFDGNGDKDEILSIITDVFSKQDIDVYDYHQLSKDEKKKLVYEYEQSIKKKDIEKYYKVVADRKQLEAAIKDKNKHTRT